MPKLSVLLPVYNGIDNYPYGMLSRSIQSILRLSDDLEIIIIDDGSTDGTVENLTIINQSLYGIGDKRIKIIALDNNQGQAVALNRGLQEATGEYIWQWSVRAMAHQGALDLITALDKSFAGFAYGRMYSYGGEREYVHTPPRKFDVGIFAKRYRCNWYMFKRVDDIEYVEYLITPDGKTIGICDRDMMMQLMDKGKTGVSLGSTLTVIYYNGGLHTTVMNNMPEYREQIDSAFTKRWGHML